MRRLHHQMTRSLRIPVSGVSVPRAPAKLAMQGKSVAMRHRSVFHVSDELYHFCTIQLQILTTDRYQLCCLLHRMQDPSAEAEEDCRQGPGFGQVGKLLNTRLHS